MGVPEPLRQALADRYAIERELGRGGMAVVYLAQDLRHDRPVALKVLLPELAASLGPERFQREIRFAARLQHPHILTVLDSGEAAGQLWFTMPFVEGESLRDRLRRERQLPVDDALRIGTEAARALDYAHQHGVVHRDIKPENILLTRDGSTLVADFGIARALTGDEGLTRTGLAVGTPAYMSPEQAAGDKALDARTDLYSLGTVLYEMLAGEPPFTGPTAQAIAAKRLTEAPPSVRLVRPTVPESVDQAIRKALAPVAADRFTGAAQFAHALQATPVATTPMPAARAATPAPTVVTPAAVPVRRRRLPVATLSLVVGVLIGVGILFAWRHNRPEASGASSDERRIAVLPFQNLGDSADAYFADGITDAIRGKLTALPGLRVTASNSSAQYRNTAKSPQEIGRELGVNYLLVGKVRWAKGPNGSRVQVSPELIEAATASSKWQQPFDAALTDVFKVQADVAGRVAQALDVAIGSKQEEVLAGRPTTNLAAYDAFLKGKAARALGTSPVTLRQAIGYQEQAVALDSGFVAAWAELSEVSSLAYLNGLPSPALADRARTAADRAVALAPEQPYGYRARGNYYRLVPGTPREAVEQYVIGLKLAPGDADLLRGLGSAEQALGKWDQALEHLRRSRSLDPRSAVTAQVLTGLLIWLRRYDEALAVANQHAALAPASLSGVQARVMIHLAQGDLAGARAEVAKPPEGVDLTTFVAYLGTYWDLYWVLDADQRALLKRLRPSAFDGDAGNWGIVLAQVYALDGDARRAAAYGDSARIAFEQQLTAAPQDAQRNVILGLALAYMGRKDDAIRAGLRGVSLGPISSDAQSGAYYQHQLARIYLLVGEQEKAIDVLEGLLKIPYYLSPGWLRIDPTFDPLRKNPRFMKLAAGTA
ncbi:MAG TPA: protein kinase [Gemmatimonadales bacterium]|nr:protein kinase [Gemmatimonadales bacterium]